MMIYCFFYENSNKMTWINEITFDNGDIPMVNDSTFDVSPKTSKLLEYAKIKNRSTTNKIVRLRLQNF